MLTRGLWENHTEAIIDIIFVYADADTYKKKGMDKLLPRWGKLRITRMGNTVTSNGNFYPFFLSVDGILGKESQGILATLS